MRNHMLADRRVSTHCCAGSGVELVYDLICDITRSRCKVAFLEPRMGCENGEMNLSGRNCRATPACNTKRTPSIDGPLNAHGWTRILQPATRLIDKGPTSSNGTSITSFNRFFMTEAHTACRFARIEVI